MQLASTQARLCHAAPCSPHPPCTQTVQAAQEWVALGSFLPASDVLALAAPWVAVFEEVAMEGDTPPIKRARYAAMVFDAHMARLAAAQHLHDLVRTRDHGGYMRVK